MGEGDSGAVEELWRQPALLIVTVADGSTCEKYKNRKDMLIKFHRHKGYRQVKHVAM